MIHAQLYELLTYNITFDLPHYQQHIHHGRVLELGVGTGRTLAPLAHAGHSCVGIDNNPDMISFCTAKYNHLGIDFQIADMTSFSLQESFQQIQVPLRAMHLLNPKQRAAAFSCMVQHLEPSGHVIVHISSWKKQTHDKIWRMHSIIPSSDGGEILIDECTYEEPHTSKLHIIHRFQQIHTQHHVSSTHVMHQKLHPIEDMMLEMRSAKLIPRILTQDDSNQFIMATKS